MTTFEYLVNGCLPDCDGCGDLTAPNSLIFQLEPSYGLGVTEIEMNLIDIQDISLDGKAGKKYIFEYDETLIGGVVLNFCHLLEPDGTFTLNGNPLCRECESNCQLQDRLDALTATVGNLDDDLDALTASVGGLDDENTTYGVSGGNLTGSDSTSVPIIIPTGNVTGLTAFVNALIASGQISASQVNDLCASVIACLDTNNDGVIDTLNIDATNVNNIQTEINTLLGQANPPQGFLDAIENFFNNACYSLPQLDSNQCGTIEKVAFQEVGGCGGFVKYTDANSTIANLLETRDPAVQIEGTLYDSPSTTAGTPISSHTITVPCDGIYEFRVVSFTVFDSSIPDVVGQIGYYIDGVKQIAPSGFPQSLGAFTNYETNLDRTNSIYLTAGTHTIDYVFYSNRITSGANQSARINLGPLGGFRSIISKPV